MIRRLSRSINRTRITDLRRRFKQGAETTLNRAKNSRYSYLRLPLLLLLGGGYALHRFVSSNYSSKKKCVDKLLSIYDEQRVRVNPNIAFFDYFFPEAPLAIVFPQFPEQVEKVIEVCNKYGVGVLVSSAEDTRVPNNLEEHDNYIIVNPKQLKSLKLNSESHTIRAGVGLQCSQLNQLLREQGYEELFDNELNNKYLFEVVNYNLPLRDETLSERLINMELVSGEGRVMQTGPEIRHIGISPCFNDLFIGSKGMFGIPLAVALRVRKEIQPVERMSLELTEVDPNYQIQTLRKLTMLFDGEAYLKYRVRSGKNVTTVDISNYGKKCLEKFVEPYQQARTVTVNNSESPKWQANAIFNINGSDLYSVMLADADIEWQYSNGLLKVRGNEKQLQQLNNSVTMHNGLLVWLKDIVMFEKLKKENAIVELGEGLILQSLNIRSFLDPQHRFVITKTYHNFVKRPSRWTLRNIVSSFW